MNEAEIGRLAERVASLGADTMNAIPLIPTKDTPFETLEKPSKRMVLGVKSEVAEHIKPMTHCARCRADAAGLLGHDLQDTPDMLREYANMPAHDTANRPYA